MYPDNVSMRLINSIKEERIKSGLTQRQAAEILEINTRTMKKYELGRKLPHLVMLLKIANLFNYDITESINFKIYHSKFCMYKIKTELRMYGLSHKELSELTGYSVSQVRNTLYMNHCGSLCCLGAICEVLSREKGAYKYRKKLCRKAKPTKKVKLCPKN